MYTRRDKQTLTTALLLVVWAIAFPTYIIVTDTEANLFGFAAAMFACFGYHILLFWCTYRKVWNHFSKKFEEYMED